MDPALATSLDRFVAAQDPVWDQVLAELRAGAKRSHWMWFVFPQLSGLGRSLQADYYGLRDTAEARAYLAHPVLGARLCQGVDVLLSHERSAYQILGTPDDLKLASCLTLFAAISSDPVFSRGLAKFFSAQGDDVTAARLGGDQ
ncbi:MAG: DUF1810 domain-containing protein [Pseudomonadota bacterium]